MTPIQGRFPSWALIAGFISGIATLIYLMGLLLLLVIFRLHVSSIAGFILSSILAFGAALSCAFLGGSAAAKGQLPIPGGTNRAIEFSITSGIAVFVIVFILSNILFPQRIPMPGTDGTTLGSYIDTLKDHNDLLNIDLLGIHKAQVEACSGDLRA